MHPVSSAAESAAAARQINAALAREIDAASSLLRHGLGILAEYNFASRDAEPLFACLAGGAEKLLKLTFGLAEVDEGREWPSRATMKHAGHRIVELDTTVRTLIGERAGRSTVPGLIRELLLMSDGHPGVVQVLGALERYAVDGRFYNLDLLGGRAQGNPSPHELWMELEHDVIEANPDMLEQFAGDERDRARSDMNRIIAWSIGLWCELIRRSWITGVIGDEARRLSSQLELGHETAPIVASAERRLANKRR